ncbi:hypothetical protein V2J09_002454 [Rumex salicifolius]
MAAAAAAVAGVLSALQLSRTTSSIYFRTNFRNISPRVYSSISSPPTERLKASNAPFKSENRNRKHASSSSSRSAPAGADASPSVSRSSRGKTSRSRAGSPPARFLHTMTDAEMRMKRREKNRTIDSGEKSAEAPKYSKAARRFYNERFREPPQRLSKVLAASGVAARRSCEELIFEGKVTVNGSVCKLPQTRVDPAKDIIYVNGSRLPKKLPPKVYFALNKPKGYICSSGEKETKSVISLFDDYLEIWDKRNPGQPKPRLFTVGRLDVATTGLIIVTNDGEFAQKVSHPSSNLTKEYIAAIDGEVNKRHLVAISKGVLIDGVLCVPGFVELLPNQLDSRRHRIRIVVHEGRNHEVRELVKNAGLELYSLKRIRIAGFKLPPDLGHGKHIELKPNDLKALGGKS